MQGARKSWLKNQAKSSKIKFSRQFGKLGFGKVVNSANGIILLFLSLLYPLYEVTDLREVLQ